MTAFEVLISNQSTVRYVQVTLNENEELLFLENLVTLIQSLLKRPVSERDPETPRDLKARVLFHSLSLKEMNKKFQFIFWVAFIQLDLDLNL